VAQAAADLEARLLLISSDRVFAGPRMFHDEAEPVSDDPQAQSLRCIEQGALSIDGNQERVLVVRTNAFGWSIQGNSFAERTWRVLDEGRSVELSTATFATPILISDLAEVLLRCLRARLSGVVHIGGAERTSPFRFGQELAMAAGFDPRLVKSSSEAEDEHAVQCCETSLGTRLVRRELDIALPLLRESVARFADQVTSGYRAQLLASAESAMAKAA
jgi:dTDP-4-dehydrorhamnose reductase